MATSDGKKIKDDQLRENLDSCLLDLQRAEETIRYQHRQLFQLEERYNELLNSLDEAFCIIEILFDNNASPIDYRFLKVNSVFEEQTGIENPLGRTMREIAPEHEQHWFEILGRIALTGEAQRFEHAAEALGKFYDVYAFRIGDPKDGQVAVLFKDIAERKRQGELQAYLLQLSDVLRPLSDPIEIQDAVTQLAMDRFDADRCYYCEIEKGKSTIRRDAFRGNLTSVSNVYPLHNFPLLTAVIKNGSPFVVHDVYTDTTLDEELRQLCIQLQVISFIDVPVIKEGIPCGVLCITCCQPRK